VGTRIHGSLDERLGLCEELRGAASRDVILGVDIGVALQEGLDTALDEMERATRSGVLAIDEYPLVKRGADFGIHADDLGTQSPRIE
jgi:hypothetical protein